jgi:glycosyltransferase involved in cell wall biosynthesis
MNIAVFHNLPDGGAKVALYEQLKRLREQHTPDLYTLVADEGEFDLKPLCRKVFVYPYETVKQKASGWPRVSGNLRSFSTLKRLHREIAADIDAAGYDAVLVYQDSLTQAPYLLRFLKTPSLYYCHEPLRMVYEYGLRLTEDVGFLKKGYEALNRALRKGIDRTNTRSAKQIVTGSAYGAEYIALAYGIHPKICPLGVDGKIFTPSGSERKNRVLFVGPTTGSKGYCLAKQSLKRISKSARPQLRALTPGTSGRFSLTRKQLVEEYASAMVLLCTSVLEPFGLTALEAMACETPVVAVREGGYRETIVDGKTGFLVARNPTEIAEKIRFLTGHPHEAQRMGRSARRHVIRNWNWERGLTLLNTYLRETAQSTDLTLIT